MANLEKTYSDNMNALSQAVPDLARNLAGLVMTNIQFAELPNQKNNDIVYSALAYDVKTQAWVPLTDANPLESAVNDANNLFPKDSKIFPLVGFGAGFFPVEVKKRMLPHQRMAIFETNPSIFKAGLHLCDVRPMLEGNAKINLFIGGDIIAQCEHWWLTFETYEKMYIGPILRSAFTQIYEKDLYDAICAKSTEMVRHHLIGLATWARHGHEMQHNDIANLPDYIGNPGMESLRNLWEGKPAICIAAGPSLKKNLKLLLDKEKRNNFCVITVGTCLKLLLSLGIKPDFVTTIDFQRLNYTDQFSDYQLPTDVPLIYLHSTYPETVKRWPGPKFVATNDSEIVQWVRNIYKQEKGSASMSQTVAHLNVFLALTLGANPIILIGQDLSMPIDEHHAVGAMAQDTAPKDAPESYYDAPDIYGNTVHVRHSFASMAVVFERIFSLNQQAKFINCTEGGVSLKGAENKALSEMLELYNNDNDHFSLTNEAYKAWNNYSINMEECRTVYEFIEQYIEISKRSIGLIDNIIKVYKLLEKDDFKNEEYRKIVLSLETFFQENTHIFNICAIKDFNIIHLLSEFTIYREWKDDEEAALWKINQLAKIAEKIYETLPYVYLGFVKALNRLGYIVIGNASREKGIVDFGMTHRMISNKVLDFKFQNIASKDLKKLYYITHQYDQILSITDDEKIRRKIYKIYDNFAKYKQNNIKHYILGEK